ncbi:MAG: hypothetical protein D6690_11160 [Nitrospirae bacterium]|nr:MAG: hypothetical protein D6690_11160 [Nitrospirota bacterium]
MREHIGDYPFYWCQKSHEKAEHAAPNHILVDDRVKSVEPFVAAGGKAILHVDFPITLRALNEILGDL